MLRHLTTLSLAAVLCVAVAAPASAQRRPQSEATARVTAPPQAELRGTGQDDRGEPLSGAGVSALGSSPVFAVSDSEGRFAFHDLSASRSTSAPGSWVAERVEFQGRRGGGGRGGGGRGRGNRGGGRGVGQQDRSEQARQRDIQALVQMVDAVAAGTQPAPADIDFRWEGNHFMKSADGETFVPFTLSVDAAQLAAPGTALYVRAVSKAAAPSSDPAAEQPAGVSYPWNDVYTLDVPPDGIIQRAMVLEPGEYEVFVAIKEASPPEDQDNQPPAKAALLRRDITVPGFTGTGLGMSSVLIGTIEPLAASLDDDQQRENPYTFGQMSVSVSTDVNKSGELQALFWIYGAQENDSKPDVQIEYSFHRQTPEGETYFNKTPPQMLNANTLPPQFDIATDQLPGMLFVPLASFPEGEYRLEIKVTDAISGETLTHNANFTVET